MEDMNKRTGDEPVINFTELNGNEPALGGFDAIAFTDKITFVSARRCGGCFWYVTLWNEKSNHSFTNGDANRAMYYIEKWMSKYPDYILEGFMIDLEFLDEIEIEVSNKSVLDFLNRSKYLASRIKSMEHREQE